jgi:hypothetical protein
VTIKVVEQPSDTVAATPDIAYSTENCTKDPVVITLTFPELMMIEDPGRVVSPSDEGGHDGAAFKREKTCTENGTDTVHYTDGAGNQGTQEITITNIDTQLNQPTLSLSPSDPTNQNVIATLKFDEEVTINTPGRTQDPENPQRRTKTFTDNTSETGEPVAYTDCAENQRDTAVVVLNIDRLPPEGTLTSDNPYWSNQDKTYTATFNETVYQPTNRTGNPTGTSFTQTVTEN